MHTGLILCSKLFQTVKQCTFVALRSRQNERIDGSRRYHWVDTQFAFLFSGPPTASSSSHPNIMVLWGAVSMQFAWKNTGAAWPKTQLGKLESGRDAAVPHFPISSLFVSLKYYFSFFLLDASIKVVAKPQRPRSYGFSSFSPVAEVIFSTLEYWKRSLGRN